MRGLFFKFSNVSENIAFTIFRVNLFRGFRKPYIRMVCRRFGKLYSYLLQGELVLGFRKPYIGMLYKFSNVSYNIVVTIFRVNCFGV
jgi:hypothetical protein